MRLVRLVAPVPSRSAGSAPGGMRRRRPVLAVALAVLAATGGSGTAWAEVAEPGTVTLTVEGTVQHAVVDRPDEAGHVEGDDDATHDHEDAGLELDTMVEVDGALYDLPESVAPTPGEGSGDVQSGDTVTVTLQAQRGLDVEEALRAAGADPGEDAADQGADARVVDVAAVRPDVTAPVPTAPTGTAPAGNAAAVTAPSLTSVLGDHTLTVLPVHWGTAPASPTPDALGALAAGTAQYWSEQSGGRIAMRTTVRNWVAIPDPGRCDTTAIMRDALAANGVPAARGNAHVAVYFPERADCGGWAGLGSIDGGNVWINGVPTADVLSHELGHNLGLGHANTATCTASGVRVSLSAQCTVSPYADLADVMGYGTSMATGNLNTGLADQLGLASVLEVTDLPATIDIARLADVGSIRAVRLPTSLGTVYVDFRPAQGRDVRRVAWAGIQVHRVVDAGGYPESQLLDMQPTSRTAFSAPALPVGGSWDIPGTGRTLTVVATDSTKATLSLQATSTASTPTATTVPQVRSVSPANGPASGGTVVTLTGSGFTGATQVAFGGIPASSLTLVSPTQIQAVAPARTRGAVDVVVTTGAGTSAVGDPARFTFLDYVGMSPARLLHDPLVTPGTVRCVQIAGRSGIPTTATSVALNVTTVGPTGPGYVVVYPDTAGTGATPPPATSTVNFDPGADVANLTFAPLPANGRLCYATRGADRVGLLLDVTGYALPGSGMRSAPPVRLLHTGDGTKQTASDAGPLQPRKVVRVQVAGHAGIPQGAASVMLNATVTHVGAPGNLRVFPADLPVPGTSVVNYAPGKDKANGTVVPLSADGAISLYSDTAEPVDVILDVLGYSIAGTDYVPVKPSRVMETRARYRIGPILGPIQAGRVYSLPVAGTAGVPADATAVVLSVAAVGPTGVGNLRVYPDTNGTTTTAPPAASTLNYIPGSDIANLVVVQLPPNGRVNFYSDQFPGQSVELLADVVGYVANG